MAVKIVMISGGTTWTVPSDFQSLNYIHCIGGGGGGSNGAYTSGVYRGKGGGGGAFAEVTGLSLTVGQTLTYQIGTAGVGGAGATPSTVNSGTAGGDTWISTTTVAPTSAAQGALAKGGGALIGGSASSSIGTLKYSGGNGGEPYGSDGGGGGSSANMFGNGVTGETYIYGGVGPNMTAGTDGSEYALFSGSNVGGGPGGNGAAFNQSIGLSGSAGRSYGGGGGGGSWQTSFAGGGGLGAVGLIVVSYNTPRPAFSFTTIID